MCVLNWCVDVPVLAERLVSERQNARAFKFDYISQLYATISHFSMECVPLCSLLCSLSFFVVFCLVAGCSSRCVRGTALVQ